MDQKQHAEMTDFRWRVASGNQQHPFTPDALEAIYLYSKGMPREACIIADNSLLAAFLSGSTVVDKRIVDLTFQDRVGNIGELKSAPAVKTKSATKSP